MITKEKLTEIVQKSVEDAWYNRRSLNPVKEHTEIIVNGIMEQLNKPAVSKCDEPVGEPAVCRNCGAKIDKWQARWGYCDADCLEEHRQTDC